MAIFYNNLIANLADPQAIVQNISTKAQAICRRRESYASTLEEELINLRSQQETISSTMQDMANAISLISGIDCNPIISKCNAIQGQLRTCVSEVESLCCRFKNKKIRIVSVGRPTQGKSLFTKIYTGLPDDIVAVKPATNGIDKTGAINVIKHDENAESPRIIVHFKKREEVLRQINMYVEQLPHEMGIRPFSSFEDVERAKASNIIINKLDTYSGSIDASVKEGLKSFFGSNKHIGEAGNPPKHISVEDIPQYNDMQYNGDNKQRYAVVDHIEIYKNLGQEYFQYFEIADTKGSSIDAGGEIADRDIFNAIDNSDAVFSITRVGSGQDNGQYILTNLFQHYQENIQSLHDKLFGIVNMENTSIHNGLQQINNIVQNIEVQQMAEQIYIGCLYRRPIDITYDDAISIDSMVDEDCIIPEKFVHSLLLDMLNRIVNNTKQNDDKLIESVNQSMQSINTSIQELKNLLQDTPAFREESEDGLILDVIRQLRDLTYNQIISSNREAGNSRLNNQHSHNRHQGHRTGGFGFNQEQDDNSHDAHQNHEDVSYTVEQPGMINYEEVYKTLRNDDISIFKLLTGENRNIHGTDNQSVKAEIEEAVKYLYKLNGKDRPEVTDAITDSVVAKPCGDTSDSGRYIECVSMMYSNQIKENFNKKLIPQNEIIFKEEADNLFKIIWDGLKLNCFTGWGDYSHEKFSEKSALNDQLKELIELYQDAYEATTDPISLFTPYDTLLDYFRRYIKKIDAGKDSKKHNETDIVIDDEILISTIVDLIRIHNIPKMIVDKATDKQRRVENLKTQIAQEIAPQTNFVQRMLPLYRLPEASPVFSNELRQRRELNDRIRRFNSAKNSTLGLSSLTTLTIPVA